MRKISQLLTLIAIVIAPLANAQQFATRYDEAAAAYQEGDYNKSGQIWADLATKGDANSQYAIAIMHLKKEAQAAKDAKAFAYLVDAAKQQHVAAMFNLGVAYWEGRGVSRQTDKALNWWEVAAKREDAGAQYNLGLAYHLGEGRPQNDQQAIHWIQQAVDNGHPQAKSLLTSLQDNEATSAAQLQSLATSSIQTTSSTPAAAEQPAAPAELNVVESIPVVEITEQKTQVAKVAKTEAPATITKAKSDPNTQGATEVKNSSSRWVELRASPDVLAASLATIKTGAAVKTLETIDGWSKVIVEKSYPVWVYEDFINDEGKGLGTIIGENVNIRPSPSTDSKTSPPLGQLGNGEKVAIVLKRGPWVKIVPAKPFPAWVASADIQ